MPTGALLGEAYERFASLCRALLQRVVDSLQIDPHSPGATPPRSPLFKRYGRSVGLPALTGVPSGKPLLASREIRIYLPESRPKTTQRGFSRGHFLLFLQPCRW